MTPHADPKKNPLSNPAFKPPGLIEKFLEALLGGSRPFDCVQIEVSSHCPGACAYCPRDALRSSWRPRSISRETVARLWPILRRAQRAHLQGWGEPLSHPDFFDLAKFAARAGAAVSTTSCGVSMNDELAARIIESDIDAIAFSLAGCDEKSNAIRGNLPFAKVCENIKLLRRKIREAGRGPKIHLAYILLGDRLDAATGLPALLRDIEADAAVVSSLDYLAKPEHAKWAILPGEKEKIAKAESILRAARAEAARDGREIYYGLPSEDASPEGGCRENAAKTLYIDADGNLSPCVYLNVPAVDPRRLIFGNANEIEPLTAWRGEDWRDFRARLADKDPHPACARCPKRTEIAG